MAKEAKAEETSTTETPPPPKSKKLLILIVGVLLIVLLVGGVGAFFLMKKSHSEDGADEEAAHETAKSSKKKGGKEVLPVYVAMDAFTVNLVPETGDQFLQLILSVEVAEASVSDRIKSYTPKIRNNVMLLLSGKKASELLTTEGKEKLANDIREQMNMILAPDAKGDGPVLEVLFTSFIIQ